MKLSICTLHLFACIVNCFPVSLGGTFQRVFMISFLDEEILVSFEGCFGNMFDVRLSLLHMFDLSVVTVRKSLGLWPEVFSHGKKTVYCS